MCQPSITRRTFVTTSAAGAAALAGVPFRMPRFDELAGGERPYLEVALKAWQWLESSRVATARGITWPANPQDSDSFGTSLYTHSPGVLPFALELFHATRDQQYLDTAIKGAEHLAAELDSIQEAGLYTGLAGLAFVFAETARASGEDRHRDLAARAMETVVRRAVPVGEGTAWPIPGGDGAAIESNDIVSGSAGIGLGLLSLERATGHGRALETAKDVGHRLLERSVPADTGKTWEMWEGYPREMPNFSHGTAGIAYFLAKLYRRTGERAFLDAALDGARYLQSIATLMDDGYLVRHHTPGGEDLYYLGWCHGPVGTSRLFYELFEATGDAEWMEWVHRGARGIMTTGVPEKRTPGFWENVSQCGGSAGLGEFFLGLYRVTQAESYNAFADRLNDDLLQRSTAESDGLKWTQAEHRVQPELLVAQTGFMQGAAGVGKYFLHVDAMRTGRAGPAIILPDAPY